MEPRDGQSANTCTVSRHHHRDLLLLLLLPPLLLAEIGLELKLCMSLHLPLDHLLSRDTLCTQLSDLILSQKIAFSLLSAFNKLVGLLDIIYWSARPQPP